MGGLRWCPDDNVGRSGAMACEQQLGLRPYVVAVRPRCAERGGQGDPGVRGHRRPLGGGGLRRRLRAPQVQKGGRGRRSCAGGLPAVFCASLHSHGPARGEGSRRAGGPYVVSMSMRTSVRCFHLVGGCWRQPGEGHLKYEDLGPIADASKYNRVCKQIASTLLGSCGEIQLS